MKFYKKWVKGRERRALLYMSMAPCFLIASILLLHFLAPELPRMIKYYLYYVSFLIGLLVFGPKAMKNATYTREDLLAAYSSLVGMGVMLFWVFHMMHLLDAEILSATFSGVFGYVFLTMAPTTIVAFFLAYELLDNRETKRTLAFRAKRFFGRILFGIVYGLIVFLAINVGTSLFGEGKLAVWLGVTAANIGLLVLIMQFKQFFTNLMNGEW